VDIPELLNNIIGHVQRAFALILSLMKAHRISWRARGWRRRQSHETADRKNCHL